MLILSFYFGVVQNIDDSQMNDSLNDFVNECFLLILTVFSNLNIFVFENPTIPKQNLTTAIKIHLKPYNFL